MISWHCAQKHKIKKTVNPLLSASFRSASLHFVSSSTTRLLHHHLVYSPCPPRVFKPGLYSRLPCSSLLRTDPARSGEEQPDPALLSEAGPAAAPGPGDQHCRAGSARLRRAHASCVFVNLCFEMCARNTPPPVCFQGDGAPVCARPTAGVCVARRRRGGGDSSC